MPTTRARTIATAVVFCATLANRAPAATTATPDQVGQWSSVLSWPIVAVHGVVLRTGKVLVWADHTANPDPARVWNPATSTFTKTPSGAYNLFCAGHCTMADGRVLVDGGHLGLDIGINNATAFDPSNQNWIPLTPMAYARWYPTATALPTGEVVAISGAISCDTCIASIPEIYDPSTNAWRQLENAPLTLPLYPFMFVLPNGKLLAAGSSEHSTATYVLDPFQQTWTTVDPLVVDGGSAAMYVPGKVLKCGTSENPDFPTGQAQANTYVLDMTQASPSWHPTAPMAFPRVYHNLTLLPDGTVLVTGGGTDPNVNNLAAAVHEAELWSPATQTWTTMAAMQTPRLYHSIALLLPDARVLVAGGGRFNGPGNPDPNDQSSAEIYSPPYLFKGARPTISSAPATIDYGTGFFLGTPDGASIVKVSLLRPGAATHAFNADQRFVDLTFQQTTGGLTVQGPADPRLAPPGYYMVFLVNANGVPSVASFVKLPVPVDTQAPSQPTNLSATAMLGGVRLSWTPSNDNVGVTGYEIHRSSSPGFTPSSANQVAQTPFTTYNDGGLGVGTYYYRVIAKDGAGNVSASSNEANATVTQGAGGLVAAYSCNEASGTTVNDVSGYANTGTLLGTTWTAGKYGGGLGFDGSTSYVDLGNPTSLRLTGSATWSAWVKALANPGDDGQIIAKSGGSAGAIGWQLKTTPDTGPMTFGVAVSSDGSTNTQRYGSTVRLLNTWYHVAGVYDAAAHKLDLYVNGVLDDGALVGTIPGSQFDPNLSVNIGKRSGGFLFNGIIDEVRVYNRALTSSEIQGDMNSPLPNAAAVDVPELPRGDSPDFARGVPNPFRTRTTLEYSVRREGRVRVEVFDVFGHRVAPLIDDIRKPGHYSVVFEPKRLASGVYLCRIESAEGVRTRKLFLLR